MNFPDARFFASYGLSAQLPESEKPEIVFCGRSNVGKSSLINKLLSRKALARVSSVPGKTATINFYQLDTAYLVDLPGYGYAKVAKTEKRRWTELIGGYFAQDRDIYLVVQLIDSRHAPSSDDLSMLDYLIDNELPFVIALTKYDKLTPTKRKERMASLEDELPQFEDLTLIPVSSETGEGIDALRDIIMDVIESAQYDSDETEDTDSELSDSDVCDEDSTNNN